MIIGEKIKYCRKKYGLKQSDLANALHVTPQAVSKWECAENLPDLVLLKKMALLFNVSMDYLVGMYDEMRDVFEATVLCSSLNQFARKAQTLSAQALAEWTHTLLYHMTSTILNQGGIPVKYTGDGILCFFSGTSHTQRAARASQNILSAHSDQPLILFMHQGDIFFGKVGHPDYATRDIYGNAVNIAFLGMQAFSNQVPRGIGITEKMKPILEKTYSLTPFSGILIPYIKEAVTLHHLHKQKEIS